MDEAPDGPQHPAQERIAMGKHLTISAARFVGVAIIILGIASHEGAIPISGMDDKFLAYGLIILGVITMFALPQFLARRWKSAE